MGPCDGISFLKKGGSSSYNEKSGDVSPLQQALAGPNSSGQLKSSLLKKGQLFKCQTLEEANDLDPFQSGFKLE